MWHVVIVMSFPNTSCLISCHFGNASLFLSLHLNIFPVYRHLRGSEKSIPDYYFALLSHFQAVPQVWGPPVTLLSPGVSLRWRRKEQAGSWIGAASEQYLFFFPACFKLRSAAPFQHNPVQTQSCSGTPHGVFEHLFLTLWMKTLLISCVCLSKSDKSLI